MEIFGSILIGIFVILLFGLGIMGCGFLIREIWGIVKDRKTVLASNTTVAAIKVPGGELMNYPMDKNEEVMPNEERPLEFTGIRAIQL